MSDISKKLDRIKKMIDTVPDGIAEEFYDRVKDRTPVDSGNLKRSWSRKGLRIENDADYATYVENGTDTASGAHMVKVTKSEVDEIIKKVIREETQ